MMEKGLALLVPAEERTLVALQAGFTHALPAWLMDFLAVQDGMSLGPIVGTNPFHRGARQLFAGVDCLLCHDR